ncbi:MAG: ATP-binding protein [Solirubrobacterales bacterium]
MARRVSSPVFIGRAEELAALGTALERAAGDRTQTVLIAGESGVGKTRLLQEFSRSDAARGAQWLSGECIALTEGELPYAPITTVLRSIPGELEDLDLTPESAPELARLVPEMGPIPAAEQSRHPALSTTHAAQLARLGRRLGPEFARELGAVAHPLRENLAQAAPP